MTILHIMRHRAVVILLVLLHCGIGLALEPGEILVIANGDNAASVRIARYYCRKRQVPTKNILRVSLGTELRNTISRNDYEKLLAEPIREKWFSLEFAGKIKCLLTTYGVPYKVGPRGPLKGLEGRLQQLKELATQEKNTIEQLQQNGFTGSAEHNERKHKLAQLQLEIDRISGKETAASVDSELSMVLFGAYELYRWQPNILRNSALDWDFRTLMVCRLDGPDYKTVKGLVDKAIAAEKTGLRGIAYIDSRGLVQRDLPARRTADSPSYVDQSLRDLAMLTRLRTEMLVKEEPTEKLFAPGASPETAIYCGWYSLKNYVDAFDFVDGAIGYHISSFEAVDLRDPNSSQWCPAMLRDGITATLGAVAEPYLNAFPEPKTFFLELFNGRCLVEAFYRTKPFNSWQLVLIGDPLYKPFKITFTKLDERRGTRDY
ncbi:MAG: TIGR03790 family protein [Phycisphaerae bacterium]